MPRLVEPNDRALRDKKIRLINEKKEQVGIVSLKEALDWADREGLDLVVVAEDKDPAVCRLMDYGKYLYEEKRRERENKKKQHQQKLKELKLHTNTNNHDVEIKIKHALEFLEEGDKVKISIMFRGRELVHSEQGMELMTSIIERLRPVAQIETEPQLVGKMITATLAPLSTKKR